MRTKSFSTSVTSLFTLLPLALLFSAATVIAHHSPAAFDTDAEVTVTGEIIEYSFRNPHVYMTLSVAREDGSEGKMEVEAGAGSVISPLGFTRNAVKKGDIVTIYGSPARRKPDSLMLGRELYKQDGSYLPLHIQSRSIYQGSDATTDTLAGTWFAGRAGFYAYLGESRAWPLTEAGRHALDTLDPKATPQKDCIPLAPPTLMLYPVANTIVVEADRIIFDIDWLDAERIVWMDGRSHPEASETFLLGHSTGHWEDDTLVIDTRNYQEHPMGLSLFVPGGTGKHMEERLSLNADGKSLSYSGTLEDPKYLSEAVSWSGQWAYQPQMQHSNESCDQEVAQRFLND